MHFYSYSVNFEIDKVEPDTTIYRIEFHLKLDSCGHSHLCEFDIRCYSVYYYFVILLHFSHITSHIFFLLWDAIRTLIQCTYFISCLCVSDSALTAKILSHDNNKCEFAFRKLNWTASEAKETQSNNNNNNNKKCITKCYENIWIITRRRANVMDESRNGYILRINFVHCISFAFRSIFGICCCWCEIRRWIQWWQICVYNVYTAHKWFMMFHILSCFHTSYFIRLHSRIMNMFLTKNYKSAKNKNKMISIFFYICTLRFCFPRTVHSSSAMNHKPEEDKKKHETNKRPTASSKILKWKRWNIFCVCVCAQSAKGEWNEQEINNPALYSSDIHLVLCMHTNTHTQTPRPTSANLKSHQINNGQ